MPKHDLTDRFCAAAKAGEGRKTDFFDLTVKGLCLRVSPGGAKSWFLVYTVPGTARRAWLKLGSYPSVSLAKARRQAREGRAAVAEGDDTLAGQLPASAAMVTVADLIENYVARRGSEVRRGDEIARRLRHDVLPMIGGLKLASLHRRDLTRVIDAVMDRGKPAAANRLFDDLRAMVRWAVARGDLDRNLADGMQRPAENVIRDRVLSELEVRSFWTGLAAAAMQEGTRRALRLCLLTGQRVGEVSGMMRNELDIDRALWTIPATRAKNGIGHAVPLSGAALEIILAQLEAVAANCQRAGLPPFPHVFPAPGGRAPIHNTAVSKAVLRRFAGLPEGKAGLADSPFTPHDLRRTAATLMEESGIAPHVIGHVLNHVSVTRGTITSRVYARYDYSREKREALETLAARISAIVAGGSRKVLPFRPEMAAGA